jgi:hypothetical protein
MRAGLGLALLLAACSPKAAEVPAGGETIDCAIGGAAAFSHDCTVEHGAQNGEPVLVVHHADGGFRRFIVADSGKSVVPADGAELLAVASNGEQVDVSVDGDRYRFPVKMLSDAARR